MLREVHEAQREDGSALRGAVVAGRAADRPGDEKVISSFLFLFNLPPPCNQTRLSLGAPCGEKREEERRAEMEDSKKKDRRKPLFFELSQSSFLLPFLFWFYNKRGGASITSPPTIPLLGHLRHRREKRLHGPGGPRQVPLLVGLEVGKRWRLVFVLVEFALHGLDHSRVGFDGSVAEGVAAMSRDDLVALVGGEVPVC